MRDDAGRLADILAAIKKIETHSGGGRSEFDADEMIRVWVVHHLQILGEAANLLTNELTGQYPLTPWRKIIGMRHVLVHHYFEIDSDLIWDVIDRDLPDLKSQIQSILDEFNSPEQLGHPN